MLVAIGIVTALSLGLLLVAAGMERSAILQRINGANGLAILAAFIVSGVASLVLALVAGWFAGPLALVGLLAGSALYHWAAWVVLLGGLQRLATRVSGAEKAAARKLTGS